MSLDYALYPNPITENPNDCKAVIKNKKVLHIDDIIEKMKDKGLSLDDSNIECVVKHYTETIIDTLSEGYTVSTPVMRISPTIRGIFLDKDDAFNPERHKIDFEITIGKALHFDTSEINVNKVKAERKAPVIMKVSDYFSETINTKISPNGTMEISGLDLKINTEEKDEGLFFVTNKMTIKAKKFYHNRNTYLVAKIPSELKGEHCKIMINKRYPCCNDLVSTTYDIEFIISPPCLGNCK
ncbi:MAG: DNA-binding domain-containing protein [Bacteroidales bacterium]